jgi:hypothetical protein
MSLLKDVGKTCKNNQNLNLMSTTINTSISRGCSCAHVDGDDATQEERTISCPEVCSIKSVKFLGGSLNNGLDGPILCKTINGGRAG